MDRRTFLKTTGLTAASVLATGRRFAAQTQPFKIGMAATLWLQADAATETYWKACEAIGSLGFKATEADNTLADLDTTYGTKVAEFEQKSAKYGVKLVGVYHSMQLHESNELPAMREKAAAVQVPQEHRRRLHRDGLGTTPALGPPRLLHAWRIAGADGRGGEERRQGAQRAGTDSAAGTRHQGLASGAQPDQGHHSAGYSTRRILKHVFLCADVGHLAGAGYNPIEAVKTYGSRVAASHWKDFDPNIPFRRADYADTINGDFVELGRGIVDFPGLVELFRQLKYTGWVQIEFDRSPKDPIVASQEMKAFVTGTLKLSI